MNLLRNATSLGLALALWGGALAGPALAEGGRFTLTKTVSGRSQPFWVTVTVNTWVAKGVKEMEAVVAVVLHL